SSFGAGGIAQERRGGLSHLSIGPNGAIAAIAGGFEIGDLLYEYNSTGAIDPAFATGVLVGDGRESTGATRFQSTGKLVLPGELDLDNDGKNFTLGAVRVADNPTQYTGGPTETLALPAGTAGDDVMTVTDDGTTLT